MFNGIGEETTFRAIVARHFANAKLEILKLGAMTTSELSEDSTSWPGKGGFRVVNPRSRSAEDPVGTRFISRLLNNFGVDAVNSRFIRTSRNDAVYKIRLN